MNWLAFLPIEPCAKARPRVTKRGTYMPKSYQDWRKRFCLMAQGSWANTQKNNALPKEPMAGRLAVTIIIYTKSGKMRPDLDNCAGACLDALQDSGVIANDRDVVRLMCMIDKSKIPGINIHVQRDGT